MPAKIVSVKKRSPADKAGIKPGDELISINNNAIEDVLDYRFYMTEERLCVVIKRGEGEREYKIKKREYDDLGLEFETYLMDCHRRCRNDCIFCFIDQMPPGMRESLYFKDDDSRLSFLFGNYITLTGLSEREIDRIIKMHISPINISVHTTNPELRVKMMKNRFAGESLKIMERFYKAGIKMNCQIVVCPGYNDGDELKRTISDLGAMYPCVESIACVPVGLTKYREGLCELKPFDQKSASETLDLIEQMGMIFAVEKGARIVYPSDEFYLLSKRELPDHDWYEDYAQLENGVGMLTLFKKEFYDALGDTDVRLHTKRRVAIATGEAAAKTITELAAAAQEKFENLTCSVYVIKNNFFGERITVAGLLTAADLADQLSNKLDADELLISSAMLKKNDDVFLDDVTLSELCDKLGIRVRPVECDGYAFLDAILNI